MPRKKKVERFEQALEQLEKIVERLEKGELPLEDALDSFTQGVELVRFCHRKLEEAERKIDQLVKSQDGQWATQPSTENDAMNDAIEGAAPVTAPPKPGASS